MDRHQSWDSRGLDPTNHWWTPAPGPSQPCSYIRTCAIHQQTSIHTKTTWATALLTSKPTAALGHLGPLRQLPQDPAQPTRRLIPTSGHPGTCSQGLGNPAPPTNGLALVQGPPGPQPHLPGGYTISKTSWTHHPAILRSSPFHQGTNTTDHTTSCVRNWLHPSEDQQ